MLVTNGNESAFSILRKMAENKRPARGVLFYGEKGVGKKTMADNYAAMLLCTADESLRPCGRCKACITVKNHTHPDVFYAAKTGKLGAISAGDSNDLKEGTVRDLRSKLYEYPIEGRNKIIIFQDCQNVGSWNQAQNMLLKILEEPPEYGYIIFTAAEKEVFIQTILSRIISVPIKKCSYEQVIEILKESCSDENLIRQAADTFGGNVGKCLEYINDPFLKVKIESIENFFKSLAFSNEYETLKALKIFFKDRQVAFECTELLAGVIRDAAVIKTSDNINDYMGCSRKAAQNLSENKSLSQIQKMYQAVKTARDSLKANLRAEFVLTALCAEFCDRP